MTRADFYNTITTWPQLIQFCRDVGCSYTSDVYSEAARDEYIEDSLVDWAREGTWQELRDRLCDIPTGYEYYEEDYGDWRPLDDGNLAAFRDDVAEWCDDCDYWDEEEDYDEYDDYIEEAPNIDPEDIDPIEEEDCSLDELFDAGHICIRNIEELERQRCQEEISALNTMLSAI